MPAPGSRARSAAARPGDRAVGRGGSGEAAAAIARAVRRDRGASSGTRGASHVVRRRPDHRERRRDRGARLQACARAQDADCRRAALAHAASGRRPAPARGERARNAREDAVARTRRSDDPRDEVARRVGRTRRSSRCSWSDRSSFPRKDWNVFWRKARAAAEKDSRIDHSRAFEQTYRLCARRRGRTSTTDHTPLPAIQPRKTVKQNLATLRKFLSQHPGADTALSQRFGRYIQRACSTRMATASIARAPVCSSRAGIPERIGEWTSVLRSAVGAGTR